MPLAWLSPRLHSLSLLPTSKLHPSRCCPGADSQVGGLVYTLGPCGPLQWTLLSDWQFVPPLQPPEIFTAKRFEALVSPRRNPGSVGLSLFPVVVPPGLSKGESGTTPPAAWLPISAPPTSLDEFGFFNSLVVGLPYSSIFWQLC